MQISPFESGLGVRFEADNLILISSTLETSYKDNIETVENTVQAVATENTVTDTFYKLIIDYEVGASAVFEFTKISDSQIIWASASSNVILDKL
ncbi:hypothetical protein [Yeosuana marina]|uniref:hypothetical protein n=1 Tax=Yeosuana marina TaxID=1565536 RepID=UPI0030C80AA9